MKTKHIYISLLFIVFAIYSNSQVYYVYDNNGNRLTSHGPYYGGMAFKKKDTIKKDSVPTVTVYPNPTTGEVNVAVSSFQNCNYATVYISDQTGNLVSTQKLTSTISPVNLSPYKQGNYYLKILICDEQYSCRVVKTTPGNGTPLKPAVPK